VTVRLINDAGKSKPLSYCRNAILKRMLDGEPSLSAKILKERVRCFYPNGYVVVTSKTVRAARAWARRQYQKAINDSTYRENLVKSLENIEVDL
jgi:hypothetical protein